MAKRRQSVSIQEEDAFRMVIDELLEDVVWHPPHADAEEANDWLIKIVDYNVPHGKQIRGRGVISAFKSFVGTPTKERLKPIFILGWCVELFGAGFYIPEDIMRSSLTRRNQICWHLVDKVGKGAVNDSFMLNALVTHILDMKFKGEPSHKHILEVFHKAFFNTCLGQSLDSIIGKSKGFHEFTMNNYFRVSKYKVGYFSFYLPMVLAKIMADDGNPDQKELAIIEEISLEMGHLFQVQDDFLDCFGDPVITGRYGTTIKSNRCTWFIVRALQKVDCMQEKILKANYGRRGEDNVEQIIRLFNDLDLPSEYRKYELEVYQGIMKRIGKLPVTIPGLFFVETLQLIMKREK